MSLTAISFVLVGGLAGMQQGDARRIGAQEEGLAHAQRSVADDRYRLVDGLVGVADRAHPHHALQDRLLDARQRRLDVDDPCGHEHEGRARGHAIEGDFKAGWPSRKLAGAPGLDAGAVLLRLGAQAVQQFGSADAVWEARRVVARGNPRDARAASVKDQDPASEAAEIGRRRKARRPGPDDDRIIGIQGRPPDARLGAGRRI
jgi:hypothetical protein